MIRIHFGSGSEVHSPDERITVRIGDSRHMGRESIVSCAGLKELVLEQSVKKGMVRALQHGKYWRVIHRVTEE